MGLYICKWNGFLHSLLPAVTKNYTRLRWSAQLNSLVSRLCPAVFRPPPLCTRTYSYSVSRSCVCDEFQTSAPQQASYVENKQEFISRSVFLNMRTWFTHNSSCSTVTLYRMSTHSPFIHSIIFLCAAANVTISQRCIKHSIQKRGYPL